MSNDGGLAESLRNWGCPLDDSTLWRQSDSGRVFMSPDEIGTAASWLPCVSPTGPETSSATCESCELYLAGMVPVHGFLSDSRP